MLTAEQKQYLHLVAMEHIEDVTDAEATVLFEERDGLFRRMTAEQRDETNDLVNAIFGEWI
jgi:hypothetical protein